jgi:hypothetical protein
MMDANNAFVNFRWNRVSDAHALMAWAFIFYRMEVQYAE